MIENIDKSKSKADFKNTEIKMEMMTLHFGLNQLK